MLRATLKGHCQRVCYFFGHNGAKIMTYFCKMRIEQQDEDISELLKKKQGQQLKSPAQRFQIETITLCMHNSG